MAEDNNKHPKKPSDKRNTTAEEQSIVSDWFAHESRNARRDKKLLTVNSWKKQGDLLNAMDNQNIEAIDHINTNMNALLQTQSFDSLLSEIQGHQASIEANVKRKQEMDNQYRKELGLKPGEAIPDLEELKKENARLAQSPNAEKAISIVNKQITELLPGLEKLGYGQGKKLTLQGVKAQLSTERHINSPLVNDKELHTIDDNDDGIISMKEVTDHLPPLPTPAVKKSAPKKGK